MSKFNDPLMLLLSVIVGFAFGFIVYSEHGLYPSITSVIAIAGLISLMLTDGFPRIFRSTERKA